MISDLRVLVSNMVRIFWTVTCFFLLVGLSFGSTEGYTMKKKVVVISDLNGSYGSVTYGREVHKAINAITEQIKPDIVIATGDLVRAKKASITQACGKDFTTP